MIIQGLMERGIIPDPYEITKEDFLEHNRIDNLGGSFGFVQKSDIGKRIFFRGGVLQMENDLQYNERKEKEKFLFNSSVRIAK